MYRKTNYDGPTFEALKILVRTYLSQLQIWQMNSTKQSKSKTALPDVNAILTNLTTDSSIESPRSLDSEESVDKSLEKEADNCNKLIENTVLVGKQTDDYLFSKIRWPYLDSMPPFCQDKLGKFDNENCDANLKSNPETDLVLKKLQVSITQNGLSLQVPCNINSKYNFNDEDYLFCSKSD